MSDEEDERKNVRGKSAYGRAKFQEAEEYNHRTEFRADQQRILNEITRQPSMIRQQEEKQQPIIEDAKLGFEDDIRECEIGWLIACAMDIDAPATMLHPQPWRNDCRERDRKIERLSNRIGWSKHVQMRWYDHRVTIQNETHADEFDMLRDLPPFEGDPILYTIAARTFDMKPSPFLSKVTDQTTRRLGQQYRYGSQLRDHPVLLMVQATLPHGSVWLVRACPFDPSTDGPVSIWMTKFGKATRHRLADVLATAWQDITRFASAVRISLTFTSSDNKDTVYRAWDLLPIIHARRLGTRQAIQTALSNHPPDFQQRVDLNRLQSQRPQPRDPVAVVDQSLSQEAQLARLVSEYTGTGKTKATGARQRRQMRRKRRRRRSRAK
jgi:hypothetical protein